MLGLSTSIVPSIPPNFETFCESFFNFHLGESENGKEMYKNRGGVHKIEQ